jgi:hypothetical protein
LNAYGGRVTARRDFYILYFESLVKFHTGGKVRKRRETAPSRFDSCTDGKVRMRKDKITGGRVSIPVPDEFRRIFLSFLLNIILRREINL